MKFALLAWLKIQVNLQVYWPIYGPILANIWANIGQYGGYFCSCYPWTAGLAEHQRDSLCRTRSMFSSYVFGSISVHYCSNQVNISISRSSDLSGSSTGWIYRTNDSIKLLEKWCFSLSVGQLMCRVLLKCRKNKV